MEWFFDPTIWLGLLTLVVLEIVLGIDNLIFIAILADKLPPEQRDKARMIGLSLALIMRLGLLAAISWLVTLTAPLFSIGSLAFSGRDLILLAGGLFLLFKATVELHERLEGSDHVQDKSRTSAGFTAVVAQIVVLDAVFSIDSVVTAVGMVDHLGVMMAAVVISMGVMMWASKPLTRFVNAHATVVILCLSFLLMIGLSLISEGLGFHIPKGYLYGAIGFSIMIEFFNQWTQRNVLKSESRIPLRDRTADRVLRLLGSKRREQQPAQDVDADQLQAFAAEERNMVSGVLSLAERSLRSIMTPRSEVSWVDLNDSADEILLQLKQTPHSLVPVCEAELDHIIGIARTKDLIADLAADGAINRHASVRPPLFIPDAADVLVAMATLKRSPGQLLVVADEFGGVLGLITPIDILEAIAGEFPGEDEHPTIQADGADRWIVDGSADLHQLGQLLETDSLDINEHYASITGWLLARFEGFPAAGAAIEIDRIRYEILEVDGRRIKKILVARVSSEDNSP